MLGLREDYLKVDSLWTRFTTFDIDKNGATVAFEGFLSTITVLGWAETPRIALDSCRRRRL